MASTSIMGKKFSSIEAASPAGVAVGKATRYGAAAALGVLRGGNKIQKYEKPVLLFGAALSALGVSSASGAAGAHLGRVGDAIVMSGIDAWATRWGLSHAGRKSAVLDKNQVHGVIGAAFDQAAKNKTYLSTDAMRVFANHQGRKASIIGSRDRRR
jgi:hypothetical protein